MALIGKIRKNFWLVLIVLGLALASFVIMDMVGASNRGGTAQADMGSVAGTHIDYRDFQRTEGALYSGSGDVYGRRDALWNYFVEQAILEDQTEGLGLGVSKDELEDLEFGVNPSPIIQNNFRNPQTGQIDRQQLNQFKTAIDNGEELNPQFKSFWLAQRKQIKKQAVQDKLSAMVAKAMYTPTWMVELDNSIASEQVSFEYIRIPFSTVEEEINVTDEEIEAYVKENADQYIPEEDTKVLQYASLKVQPTAADSAMWRTDLEESMVEFRVTADDSLFAANNNGFMTPVYGSLDDMTESVKDVLPTMSEGDVYGPYVEGTNYVAVKLVDKRVVPDSVEARHILRSVAQGSPASAYDDATAYVDSLRGLLSSGQASFDSLAIKNSQDPGSASQGGDLGSFTQGRMVGPFNDAVFLGEKGGLYTVRTQFGVHLIEVLDQVYEDREPKYKLAFISTPITPSQETQEAAFDVIANIVDNNRTMDELTGAINDTPGLKLTTAAPVKQNDYIFGTLAPGQNSRDIIRWAYDSDTQVGDVSPAVYTVSDQVNYYDSEYLLVALKSENKAGEYDLQSLRSTVEGLVANQKRGALIASNIVDKDLADMAVDYETTVRTANNVTMTMSTIPGLGREPEVQATALSLAEGTISEPIVGSGGVYVVRPTSKSANTLVGDIPSKRKSMNASARSSVNRDMMTALKDMYPVEDKRSDFF